MLAFCKRLSLVLGAVAGVALASSAASAQTTTTVGNFNVLLTVDAYCEVTNPTDLDFGTAPNLINANIDAQSALDVQCTDTTPYDIGLTDGANSVVAGVRRMTDGSSHYVTYELHRDNTYATPWGTTVGTDTKSGLGTGSVVTLDVFGRVPVQAAPVPGNYTDTVDIELTY